MNINDQMTVESNETHYKRCSVWRERNVLHSFSSAAINRRRRLVMNGEARAIDENICAQIGPRCRSLTHLIADRIMKLSLSSKSTDS